ncbi:MAG: hypothetical protein ACYSSI_03495 [Planctomycetota bacterium]|jgi:hypothetical protein
MLELPIGEMILFVSAGMLSLAAAMVGIVQLRGGGEKYRRMLLGIVCLVICLGDYPKSSSIDGII